jgi:hypothetical protein
MFENNDNIQLRDENNKKWEKLLKSRKNQTNLLKIKK